MGHPTVTKCNSILVLQKKHAIGLVPINVNLNSFDQNTGVQLGKLFSDGFFLILLNRSD